MTRNSTWPQYLTAVPYSEESSLNTLDVCLPRPASTEDVSRLWIIYIHGGAWRDPTIDASSFAKTRDALLSSSAADRIAGYASLNYRLSPSPSHSTHPSDPSDPARNARHPDHINDVLTALLYLQEQYGFEHRYLLVGHSCGSTLAFQVAMKRYWGSQYESTYALELNVVPPLAIVGLEGLYDLPVLVRNHETQPMYRQFVQSAFGSIDWATVSPTHGNYNESWQDGRLVVIGYSQDDTLVEPEQGHLQQQALFDSGWKKEGSRSRSVLTCDLQGDHDEVWQTEEAARAILFAIQHLPSSG